MTDRTGFVARDGRLPDRAALPAERAGPARGRGRRAAERVFEITLALLLTLLCFSALLLILDRAFPSATALGELMRAADAEGFASRPGAVLAGTGVELREAVLSVIGNEVLHKTSGSVAWDPAQQGAHLGQGDGVQTRREGMAVLTFDRDEWLRVGRNSLVILRNTNELDASGGAITVYGGGGEGSPAESQAAAAHEPARALSTWGDDRGAAPGRTAITLVAGEVWGHFSGRQGGPVQVDLQGSGQSVRIDRAADGTRPSRFKVSMRPDHSAAVTMFDGHSNVTIGQRTVRLGPSQYLVLRASELVGIVRTLPAAPALSAPEEGRTWWFREFPPVVTFRWKAAEGDGFHRLEIARDERFRDVVFNESVEGDSLSLGSLPPGEYVWRVSGMRAGVDGSPSAVRRMSLVLDQSPPRLEVAFPDGPVETDHARIEGVTEPDSRLFVAGVAAAPDADGRFSIDTILRPGSNLVVVEAVDTAGNSTYRSQTVRRVNRP